MIRKMEKHDWDAVASIYQKGIESGTATFTTLCPTYAEWDKAHLPECRLVFEENGLVLGWIAGAPTSARDAYKGVVEVSIYVDDSCHGNGIGTSLMSAFIEEARKNGIWSLYSVIFSVNKHSIQFHKHCGFREIGYRERIAKDRFGQWQNTTLMEYRL